MIISFYDQTTQKLKFLKNNFWNMKSESKEYAQCDAYIKYAIWLKIAIAQWDAHVKYAIWLLLLLLNVMHISNMLYCSYCYLTDFLNIN